MNPILLLMQIDVYSCAEFDPYKIAEKIKNDFDVVKIDYKYLNRETGLKTNTIKKSEVRLCNFVANVPYIKCYVRKEYLYDLEKGHGEFEECVLNCCQVHAR